MSKVSFIISLDDDSPAEMKGWSQLQDSIEHEYEIWRDTEGNQYRLELLEDGLGQVTQINPSEADYKS